MSIPANASAQAIAEARDELTKALHTERAALTATQNAARLLVALLGLLLLLACGFAAVWLDDGWKLSEAETWVLLGLLGTAALFLIAGTIAATAASSVADAGAQQFGESLAVLDPRADAGRSIEVLLAAVERAHRRLVATKRRLGAAVVLAILGLVAIAVQGIVFAFDARPREASANSADPLIARHAPVVLLHPAERYGPLDPAMALAGSQLRWRKPGRDSTITARVQAKRLGSKCLADGDCSAFGAFLPFQLTRPNQRGDERPRRLGVSRGMYLELRNALHRGQLVPQPPVPAFYEDVSANDVQPRRVIYWFFFGFSQPYSRGRQTRGHEGDWERVAVVFNDAQEPRALISSRRERISWSTVAKTAVRGHPVLYAAKGSHSLHLVPAPAKSRKSLVCEGERGVRRCAREPRAAGLRWETWKTPAGLRDVREQGWFGYGGAWGHTGARLGLTGARGPSQHTTPLKASDP